MSKKILVFAPHPDDEILGCGGTILKRVKQGYEAYVCLATMVSDWETRINEMVKADKILGVSGIKMLMMHELELDKYDRRILNGKVLNVIKEIQPNEVYIPYRYDLHSDHSILSEAVIVATRPKYEFTPSKVLAYETMSETGWNYLSLENSFSPNVYEDITDTVDYKLEALMIYESQLSEYPSCRSIKAIKSLATFRGTQAEMPYAEAFMLVREYRV